MYNHTEKIARGLKLLSYDVEGLFCLLFSYREADLYCFRIYAQSRFSNDTVVLA